MCLFRYAYLSLLPAARNTGGQDAGPVHPGDKNAPGRYNEEYLLKGKIYDQQCREALLASGVKNVVQMPFISNMDMAYRAADLVVSRAGASSISELQLLGKAAILVPSPNVAEDHQTKNAQALATRGAAIMITDADAGQSLVPTMIDTVTDTAVTASLADNVGQMALRHSAELIVDEVARIILRNNSDQ